MLTYNMDERGDESLYEYLYACIRADIERGTVAAGQRLPSKRALARHLGVSLITVESAYAQLVAEGYVRAEERRGYFASALDVRRTPRAHAPALGPRGLAARAEVGATPTVSEAACAVAQPPVIADFTGRTVARGLFPYAAWAKTLREVLTCESEDTLLAESPTAGSPRLREELAGYLRACRGMDVDPSQVVVGAGAQVLYNFIVQLLGRNRRYAVETPGYPRLTDIYRANDVHLAHIPLDAGGMRMDALRQSGADVAHIMPSHQFPTGQVTSVSRRYELLGWASEVPGRYIVEDDYDWEFRLSGRPIPALQSIDASDCVIYTNTFAKSLGPAFRLGYMVLPRPLARLFGERLGFYSCTVSSIEQLALARFIAAGDYERHVNRARAYWRNVRNDLVEALCACPVADTLDVEVTDAGLHFLLGVHAGVPDAQIVHAARARGIVLAPLTDYCVSNVSAMSNISNLQGAREAAPQAPADFSGRFVMNYAGLTREQIAPAVTALAQALANVTHG